ncbi:MAG: hypothetical protein KDH92_03810 [Chloroflexi bacterium]|nr:hypothetical protein [Chloroflexota bacterium]
MLRSTPEPGSGWCGVLPDLARLLVPLYGSPFSERDLPMARSLAKQVVSHNAGEVFRVPDMARGASAMDGAGG